MSKIMAGGGVKRKKNGFGKGGARKEAVASVPILSKEFFVQNHADIVSCISIIFVIGTIFRVTSPVASMFTMLQHNITNSGTVYPEQRFAMYTYGLYDLLTVSFYMTICIVLHAVYQECILDKLNNRSHLSKVKHIKFNESGQLALFYAVSVVFGFNVIAYEGHSLDATVLWEDYPHPISYNECKGPGEDHISVSFNNGFGIKCFFIAQFAYWLHLIPELYLRKIKTDEAFAQLEYILIYLFFLTTGYVLNLNRLAFVLFLIHYAAEIVFHISRLFYYSNLRDWSNRGFRLWNVMFILARFSTVTLTVLTLWYGLSKTSVEEINVRTGNFNAPLVRFHCLSAIFLSQAFITWGFVAFHVRRARERVTDASEALLAAKELADSLSNAAASAERDALRRAKKMNGHRAMGSDRDAEDRRKLNLPNGSVRHRVTTQSL